MYRLKLNIDYTNIIIPKKIQLMVTDFLNGIICASGFIFISSLIVTSWCVIPVGFLIRYRFDIKKIYTHMRAIDITSNLIHTDNTKLLFEVDELRAEIEMIRAETEALRGGCGCDEKCDS
jgi:hypothetical protein